MWQAGVRLVHNEQSRRNNSLAGKERAASLPGNHGRDSAGGRTDRHVLPAGRPCLMTDYSGDLGQFRIRISPVLALSAAALQQGFRQQLGILKEVPGVFHAAAYISFGIIGQPPVAWAELVDPQGTQSLQ